MPPRMERLKELGIIEDFRWERSPIDGGITVAMKFERDSTMPIRFNTDLLRGSSSNRTKTYAKHSRSQKCGKKTGGQRARTALANACAVACMPSQSGSLLTSFVGIRWKP